MLSEGNFLPEIHLKQPLPCGSFTESIERIQAFKETGNSIHIYQNKQDIICFQHDMVYWDLKNISIRIACGKLLRDKAFDIAENPKYDRHPCGLASVVYKSLIERQLVQIPNGSAIKSKIMSNQNLAYEL